MRYGCEAKRRGTRRGPICSVYLIDGGRRASLETAMALTGHRSVATVMKYYREVSQQDLASAVRSIDAPVARENTAEAQGS